ncbi:TonB-dependent receptor domain-containing protein [Lysobacter cavernae]|uniref:TonB-dependent receptor domain-containing protein n=1 Tax=Lysobacter cavernae TaxID=1685901 RepID=A0ABV7RMT7_9GAMM
MTLKTTKLRDAIVFALCVSATTVAGTGLAFAQETPAPAAQETPAPAAQATDEATTLDRIQVTGSRIAIPGLTTTSPVMTVERQDIDRAQPVSAEDFLKQQPSAVPAMGSGMNNGTAGAATLDLRGLGPNRTLVLVDGRRIVPFDLNGIVDTNVIPVALLQSVDLVTGGASAVYGADAISGVANFILRRDFEGLQVDSFYGQSSNNDAAKRRTDVTVGAGFDDGRGNVVLSIGHSEQDPLTQGERPYGVFSRSSTSGNPQGSGTAVPANVFGEFEVGGTPLPDGTFGGPLASFNFNPPNYYQTGLDRYQATALGRYEITDKAEAYAQLLYTRSDVESQLAASGTFLNTYGVPIGNPYLTDAARAQLCGDRAGLQASILQSLIDGGMDPAEAQAQAQAQAPLITNCAAGSTEEVNLAIGRRMTELGTRLNDFHNKTYQFTVGLRGDLSDHWRYDTYWSHGESDQVQTRTNWGSNAKVQQALRAISTTECLNTAQDCVPLNLFGPEGSITPAMVDFINQGAILLQGVRQDVFSASVSGDLGDGFKSPWADYPIGLVFGVEHRDANAFNRSDSASVAGDVLGAGGASPDLDGSFTLKEAYTEFLVPILSDLPGAYALNFEGGYRYSKFAVGNASSQDYGTWKAGLDWAPIESLRFRGMFQHATRAPNINELFFPATTGLDNRADDPCADDGLNPANNNVAGTLENLCVQQGVPGFLIGGTPGDDTDDGLQEPSAGQINALFGGDLTLKPEEADTQTIGLVWTPSFGGNEFAVTLDYWKIEMEDTITGFTTDDFFENCYDAAKNPGLSINNFFCANMGRNPLNGSFNGVESIGPDERSKNLGTLSTDGFDLGLRYGFEMGSWGRLDLAFDGTHVRSSKFKATDVSTEHECAGFYSVACGNLTFKNRFNQRTVWSINDFDIGLNWRYMSSMEVEPGAGNFFAPYRQIDAYNYFDLSFGWKAPFNAKFTLTVNNIADKDPPIVGNTIGSTSQNSGNTFPQVYDVLGRFYTLGVSMKF